MKKKMTRIFLFSELCPHSEFSPFEKKNLENLVCKISQKVFKLVLSYLVC